MAIVKFGAELLYDHLQRAGVKIFEYCKRPLHGKVALVDYEWATVGSSNLDPLSLSLNLEANVIIRDGEFNHLLHERLQDIMSHSCTQVEVDETRGAGWWPVIRSAIVFHVLRHFPLWLSWLPAHAPHLTAPDGSPPEPKPSQPITEPPHPSERQHASS